jgi:hypothetical protein
MHKNPYRVTLFIVMMMFSSLCISDEFDDGDSSSTSMSVDLGKYSVTPDEIKKSVIRSLLDYRWNIDKVSQKHYLANYKNGVAELAIDVKDNSIVISSVKNVKEKWLRSLKMALGLQLQYYTYLKRNDP